MAVRAVIYDDQRGGYIDNVPATFTRKNTDVGIHYADYATACSAGAPANGVCPAGNANATAFGVPPGSPVDQQRQPARQCHQPRYLRRIPRRGLYKFNDDWNLLITQSYQDMDSQGVFYQQPNASDGAPLQPLEVTLFNPSYDKDKFESTAWTVNGKFGNLKAVYTGGYLVRNVEQVGDYTNYARGVYADYYQCYGPGSGLRQDPSLTSTCFSPSASWHSTERNVHQQHEFRLSTPDEWRLRAIARRVLGGQRAVRPDRLACTRPCRPAPATDARHTRHGNTGCLPNVGTFPGTTVQNPGVQSDNTSFYQDQVRETKQTGFLRLGRLRPDSEGVDVHRRHAPFPVRELHGRQRAVEFRLLRGRRAAGGCHQTPAVLSYNLNARELCATRESGFKSRGNLTWHITPDAMVYYTFSQGFRPGGFNQNGGSRMPSRPGARWRAAVRHSPGSYSSDKLTNNEIGWKTEFFDHRLQWNGALYRENWDNVQVAFFDPGVVGNIFFNTNGQNFLIKGIETSARGPRRDRVDCAGSGVVEPEPADQFAGADRQQSASTNFGKPITQVCNTSGTNCSPVTNPFGPIGSPERQCAAAAVQRCAPATSGTSAGTLPTFSSALPTTAIRSRRRVPIPTFGPGGPSAPPGALRASRLHRSTTLRSASRRTPGG